MRQRHAASEERAETHERRERPGDGAEVHDDLRVLRQRDGLGILPAVLAVAVERRREPKQGSGEDGRERRHGTHGRKLLEVGAEALHAVAHPRTDARNGSGEARLRADGAAEEQRQQRGDRHDAQLVVVVASVALHLRHDHVQILGVGAEFLGEQADHQAPDEAGDQGEVEAEVRSHVIPDKRDAQIHGEQKHPHECASHGAGDDDGRDEQRAVRELRGVHVRPPTARRRYRGLRVGHRLPQPRARRARWLAA